MSNIMDIHIYDLQGNEYDINNINIQGNDSIEIIIKKPNEEYKPLSTAY
mgnify:CR=1 FL=1